MLQKRLLTWISWKKLDVKITRLYMCNLYTSFEWIQFLYLKYSKFVNIFLTKNYLSRVNGQSWFFSDTSSLVAPTFEKNDGTFVIGWFLCQTFDWHFERYFEKAFKRYCCPELKLRKTGHLKSYFVKLWGLRDCKLSQFEIINARYFSCY